MRRRLTLLAILAGLLLPSTGRAGFTQTLPANTFMLDLVHTHSWVRNGFDNDGNKAQLIDRIERYEPGGGKQGTIIPNAVAKLHVLVPQLQYGILDFLTIAVGIPIVLHAEVNPELGWVPGDYHWMLGRAYGDSDFWAWAASMGQPKPGTWVGNKGVLSDIIIGVRYRFSDHIRVLRKYGLAMTLTAYGALPTGQQKDPEQLASAGTTSWELHFQGELGFHLSVDKTFRSLGGRLTLGLDLFHEIHFEHTWQTPKGTINPLILSFSSYVGETYRMDPGDFTGVSFQADFVAIKGPVWGTWITGGDASRAAALPPLLTISLRYTFTWLGQSDWKSNSELWDWTQEKLWRPGYKNGLTAMVTLSLLRVGVPIQIYGRYRNLSWLPGKNCRAPDVVSVGIRAPFRLWGRRKQKKELKKAGT